jgi:hypothetical protein
LSCAQDAELVSLRISEHDPRLLALSDVDSRGPQREQTIDLAILIHGAEVKVKTILDHLRLRHPNEEESGKLLRRWPNLTHVGSFVNDDPLERPLPPASQHRRISSVDVRLFPLETHVFILQMGEEWATLHFEHATPHHITAQE